MSKEDLKKNIDLEIEQAEKELAKIKEKTSDYQRAENELKKSCQDLETLKSNLNTEIVSLTKKRNTSRAEYENETKKHKESIKEQLETLNNLAKEYVIMESHYKKLSKNIEELENSKKVLNTEILNSKSTLNETNASINALRVKEKSIDESILLKNNEIRDIKERREKIVAQYDEEDKALNNSIAYKRNEITDLDKSINVLGNEIDVLKNTKSTVQSEIESLNKTVSSIEDDISEKNTQLENTSVELKNAQDNLKEVKKQINHITDMKIQLERKELFIKSKYEEIGLQY